MSGFQFHGELFELRTDVQQELDAQGYQWLSHYRSVDLDHHQYGLEVCGIDIEDDARAIEKILRALFPDWKYYRTFYWDYSLDDGWKVEIWKYSDTDDG